MCIKQEKKIRKKNGFPIRHIFHLSPSVGLYSKSSWFEVGWLKQFLSCAPWSFPSLETLPSQGSSCSSCPCPPPSSHRIHGFQTGPEAQAHPKPRGGIPGRCQSAAGTDKSTCNQEFCSSVSLGREMPWNWSRKFLSAAFHWAGTQTLTGERTLHLRILPSSFYSVWSS